MDKIISEEEVLRLTTEQKRLLSKGGVRYALKNKFITLADLGSKIKINAQRQVSLDLEKNIEIEGQVVSLTSLLNIEWQAAHVSTEPGIKRWLRQGDIKIERILTSRVYDDYYKHFKLDDFSLHCVVEGIAEQKLEIEQVLSLTPDQHLNLISAPTSRRNFHDLNDTLRKCLEEGVFTLKEFLELPDRVPDTTMEALADPETRTTYKLRKAGPPKLTLAVLFEMNIRDVFNPQQSTPYY